MSSNTDKINYTSPRDWVNWSYDFRSRARTTRLWDYINPDTLKPWLNEPIPPNITDYPRRLICSIETRASSQTASSQTAQYQSLYLGLEEVDLYNPPDSIADIITEGKANY